MLRMCVCKYVCVCMCVRVRVRVRVCVCVYVRARVRVCVGAADACVEVSGSVGNCDRKEHSSPSLFCLSESCQPSSPPIRLPRSDKHADRLPSYLTLVRLTNQMHPSLGMK